VVSFVKINDMILFDVFPDAVKVTSDLPRTRLLFLEDINKILLYKKGRKVEKLLQVWRF